MLNSILIIPHILRSNNIPHIGLRTWYNNPTHTKGVLNPVASTKLLVTANAGKNEAANAISVISSTLFWASFLWMRYARSWRHCSLFYHEEYLPSIIPKLIRVPIPTPNAWYFRSVLKQKGVAVLRLRMRTMGVRMVKPITEPNCTPFLKQCQVRRVKFNSLESWILVHSVIY